MKKTGWIVLVCLLCFLFGGCGGRKAMTQLKQAPFLHAVGTSIMDADGNRVKVKSKRIILSAQTTDIAVVQMALAQEGYNALTLRIMSDMVEDVGETWELKEQTRDFILQTMQKCRETSRYLFVEMGEYPEEYFAWYDDSDFNENVIGLWSALAELMKGEEYLGAYVVNNIPRPGASDTNTALESYETLLQQICDAIRLKDEQQMIVVGMLTPYTPEEDAYHAFPMVKDPNFAYVAPLEDLYFYTQQQKTSADAGAYLNYPNTFWYGVDKINSFETIYGSEISTSSTDYQTRATEVFEATEEGLFARIGTNVIPADKNGGGELRVLSLRFVECDANGKEINVIYNMDSSVGVPFKYRIMGGSFGDGSVYDDGTAYLESISGTTFFYVSDLNIPLEKGKRYQLTVTMKQRGMNSDFSCTPAVQMFRCEEYRTFDAEMIQNNCNILFAQAQQVGVPLIYNDVGVDETVTEEKGKLQFLHDVFSAIDLLGQNYITY